MRMKILFSAEKFYPPVSGAERNVLNLFRELSKKHEVEGICTGEKNQIIEHEGIKIYHVKTPFSHLRSWVKRYFLNKLWFNVFDSFLKKRDYDLVVTQTELTPASTIIAKKYKIPTLIFVRDYQHFCLSILRDVEIPKKHNCLKHATWKYKIQYPFFKKTIEWFKIAFEKADIVITNSKFVQKVAKEYGVESEVIYPFVKIKKYKTKVKNPKYITLVRPCIRKGVDIFLSIADRLPNKEFLAVGDTERFKELKRRENIKYVPWTDDMGSIYAQTKILLLPSIWQEPSSSVPLEAMCNGIPCIVSNTGGTPEKVENAGIIIDDLFNVDAWVNAIERLEDKNFYKNLSNKGRKQVKKFSFEEQYKKFEKTIEKFK